MSRRQQLAQQQQTHCRCGAATRDGASTCEECLTVLYNLLTEDVPWLDEQLDVSIAGQRSVHFQPGHSGGSVSTGIMLNEHASAARRRLQRVLEQWVRFCLEHQVRNSAPTQEEPRRQISVMAEWLSWRVDGLAWWPSAYHARSGLEAAVEHARKVVTWKPPTKIFLGKCNLPIDVSNKQLRCQGDVYALEDATSLNDVGHCRTCGQPHLVAGMREKLEAELDGRLCTAAEIARMMVYLGADGSSDRLRKRVTDRIYQWHTRGVIIPVPCAATQEDGKPRYRYGDVKARLAVEFPTTEEIS